MIRWTQREWRLIADRLVQQGVTPEKHGWRSEVVSAMKMVLPKDRWRTEHSLNDVKKVLRPLMSEAKLAHVSEREVQSTPPPGAASLSTEELLVELARRIAKMTEAAKPLPVDRGFFPPPKSEKEDSTENNIGRTRILIVGPQGDQQHRLQQTFPTLCLRFVSSAENAREIYKRGATCREVILWTKFMSHAHQDAANQLKTMLWHTNTMQQIEERLATWATT